LICVNAQRALGGANASESSASAAAKAAEDDKAAAERADRMIQRN